MPTLPADLRSHEDEYDLVGTDQGLGPPMNGFRPILDCLPGLRPTDNQLSVPFAVS